MHLKNVNIKLKGTTTALFGIPYLDLKTEKDKPMVHVDVRVIYSPADKRPYLHVKFDELSTKQMEKIYAYCKKLAVASLKGKFKLVARTQSRYSNCFVYRKREGLVTSSMFDDSYSRTTFYLKKV